MIYNNLRMHDISQPGYDISQPGHDISQPGHDISQPGHDISQPGYDISQPGHDISQPGHDISQPGLLLTIYHCSSIIMVRHVASSLSLFKYFILLYFITVHLLHVMLQSFTC